MLEEYRHAARHEMCACGLEIVAGPSDASIVLAVRAHQQTQRHRDWWRSVEGDVEK